MKPEKKNKKEIHNAYFISTISITMVLLVFGYTVLLLINGKILSDYIKENIGFTVYIADNAGQAQVKRLEKYLNTRPYAHSVRYISKDEATAIMRKELGDEFNILPEANIFPASLEVSLNAGYASTDSIDIIRKSLSKYTAAEEIYYQESMAELINRNIRKMSLAGFAFTALFLLISISLINNMIRISVYSKKQFIKISRLLGAEDSFIRRPFVVNAVISGLLAGSLASLILVITVIAMRKNFSEILHIQGEYISAVAVMIFGIIITGISAQLAANKFIRAKSEQYFIEN